MLQNRLESTQTGQIVFSHFGFPMGPSDPMLRQIQDVHAEVVLVDIDPETDSPGHPRHRTHPLQHQ